MKRENFKKKREYHVAATPASKHSIKHMFSNLKQLY